MKIVHVITRLLNAGSEENTVASALHQAKAGHDVWIVHGDDFNPAWYDSLSSSVRLLEVRDMIHSVSAPKDWSAIWGLRKLYKEIKPDVVHTHQSKAGVLGRVAAIGLGVPALVHTVHIAPFLNVSALAKTVFVFIEVMCALATDVIISVSGGMRDACLAHGIGRRHQHVVIHSGMPLERYQTATPPADWRARIGGWGGETRPKVVLMLAAFEPRKRQEEFLVAMDQHLKADQDLCLLFAGAGERLERVRGRAEALGIADQVRFLGHDPEPETLIALADVCVLTSEREGLPRVVVQYLAGGKPVILTDLPGIQEIVVPDHNGLIVPADDVQGAAEATAALLADPVQLDVLSMGAQATDVSPWAQDRMGAEIQQAYERVLERKGKVRLAPVSGVAA